MDPKLAEDVRVLNKVRSRKSARIYVKRARYNRVNERRGELIAADTPKDDPELAALNRCVFRLVNLAFPLPKPSRALAAVLEKYRRVPVCNPDGTATGEFTHAERP